MNIFLKIYFQIPGPKDLVIDPELTKPLDRVAGISFLKVGLFSPCVLTAIQSSILLLGLKLFFRDFGFPTDPISQIQKTFFFHQKEIMRCEGKCQKNN